MTTHRTLFIAHRREHTSYDAPIVDLFETANRRILTLKPGKERLVANRHPWIFAGAIARESGPEDAAIADLLDPRGRRIASGFHSQHSQIRVRALTFGDEVLTEETIRERMIAAIARRSSRMPARLINAEGDELSGLIDRSIRRHRSSSKSPTPASSSFARSSLMCCSSELTPRGIWFKNDIPPRKIEKLSMEPEWIGRASRPRRSAKTDSASASIPPRGRRPDSFSISARTASSRARSRKAAAC